MNFFQRYQAKQSKEIEPPTVNPPVLPSEQEIDTVQPIHVDDAQYLLLTRALRPGSAPVREGFEVDPPGPNVPAVEDRAGQPPATAPRTISADQPPGTPIV